MPRTMLFRSTIRGSAIGIAALAGLGGGVNWLIPGSIENHATLPPIAAVRADGLTLRSLPNGQSPALAVLPRGRMVHLRCRDGAPLHLGPWLGVIDGASDRIGWVHGSYVSDAVGACPASQPAAPDWRLRPTEITTEGVVNLRFGPSTNTIPLAKLPSGEALRTDGRWVEAGGARWVLVRTSSGLVGWVRSDLTGHPFSRASLLPLPPLQATGGGPDVVPHVGLSVGTELEVTVGATYRPTGPTAALQRLVASQLEAGLAAQILARSDPPGSVRVEGDGAIRLQLELYRASVAAPATYLEGNLEDMTRSLLIGNGTLARHVEEVHGPEAALLLRAAFLVTGVPEPMADIAFVLLRDPAVQAQMSVLAASGLEMSRLMAAAAVASRHGPNPDLERLHFAARGVEREIRRSGGVSAQRLASLAEVELVRSRSGLEQGIERISSSLDSRVRRAASALPTPGDVGSRAATRSDAVVQEAVSRTNALARDARNAVQGRVESQVGTARDAVAASGRQLYERGRQETGALGRQVQEQAQVRGHQGRQQADQLREQTEAAARQRAELARIQAEEMRGRTQAAARQQAEQSRLLVEQARRQAQDQARAQADQMRRQAEDAARRFQDQGRQQVQTMRDMLRRGGG